MSRRRLEDRMATIRVGRDRIPVGVRWEVLGPSDNPERHLEPMQFVISRWDDAAGDEDEWYIDPDLIVEMADAIRHHRANTSQEEE